MKFRAPALSGLLLTFVAATAGADKLGEVYELALANDAQLKSLKARYLADAEARNLSRAALLPRVDANYDYTDSNTDTVSNNPTFDRMNNEFIIQRSATTTDVDRQGYQISLNQPLFDLPAWFSFQAGASTSKQAQATFAADQQDLIERVVGTYFGVLRAQDSLQSSLARERAFQRHLEQTRQRFEVGLTAITDVHEAQAAYDLSQVNRITDENDVNVALERLSVLTGQYHANLYQLGEEFAVLKPDPETRRDWVDFALQNNYRLRAARHAEQAARQSAKASRALHLPSVRAVLAYSDYETEGDLRRDPPSIFDVDPGSDEERESIQLRVDVPLFHGGAISAGRRRAAQNYIAALESRVNLMRNIVTDTRSLHMTVVSDVARVAARRQSIVSSQSALDATTAGYEVGTRNIVDVLDAQNTLYAAKRDYANARYDYIANHLRLKNRAGILSPEDVYELERHLTPPPAPTASRRTGTPYPGSE